MIGMYIFYRFNLLIRFVYAHFCSIYKIKYTKMIEIFANFSFDAIVHRCVNVFNRQQRFKIDNRQKIRNRTRTTMHQHFSVELNAVLL